MNYIQQLKADVAANANELMRLQECIRDLKGLVPSPKHQGVQQDGERNDWIASGDIVRWADRALQA